MTDHRPGTDLAVFASLLVVLATAALASLGIADAPTSLAPQMLAFALLGLGLFAAALLARARRARLLMVAAPALILVGGLHLLLAVTTLTGSAAASAGIGGVAELLLGLALLPGVLAASVDAPMLRERLREARRVGGQAGPEEDARFDQLRRQALIWERHARNMEARLTLVGERYLALRRAVRSSYGAPDPGPAELRLAAPPWDRPDRGPGRRSDRLIADDAGLSALDLAATTLPSGEPALA